MNCPQCGSETGIKIVNTDNTPKGVDTYCEDCGWPDDDRSKMNIELEHMEVSAAELGKTIGDALNDGYAGKVRFCIILASNEVGWFTYVSNIQRDSTIELLKEAVEKLSADPSGIGSLAQ